MKIEPKDSRYIVKTVREDLEYLITEWTQDIDEKSLRISSGILRRLLLEDALGRAWRLAGFEKEPSIKAFGLGCLLSSEGPSTISFAQAGGAKVRGCQISSITQRKRPRSFNKLKGPPYIPAPVQYSLNQFIESVCMVIEGQIVRRREVIKYVANKLGGVHIDTVRGNPKSEKKHKAEKVFLLLDNVFKSRETLKKNAVFYELLSIGQDLINSNDIKMFVEKTKLIDCDKKESYF